MRYEQTWIELIAAAVEAGAERIWLKTGIEGTGEIDPDRRVVLRCTWDGGTTGQAEVLQQRMQDLQRVFDTEARRDATVQGWSVEGNGDPESGAGWGVKVWCQAGTAGREELLAQRIDNGAWTAGRLSPVPVVVGSHEIKSLAGRWYEAAVNGASIEGWTVLVLEGEEDGSLNMLAGGRAWRVPLPRVYPVLGPKLTVRVLGATGMERKHWPHEARIWKRIREMLLDTISRRMWDGVPVMLREHDAQDLAARGRRPGAMLPEEARMLRIWTSPRHEGEMERDYVDVKDEHNLVVVDPEDFGEDPQGLLATLASAVREGTVFRGVKVLEGNCRLKGRDWYETLNRVEKIRLWWEQEVEGKTEIVEVDGGDPQWGHPCMIPPERIVLEMTIRGGDRRRHHVEEEIGWCVAGGPDAEDVRAAVVQRGVLASEDYELARVQKRVERMLGEANGSPGAEEGWFREESIRAVQGRERLVAERIADTAQELVGKGMLGEGRRVIVGTELDEGRRKAMVTVRWDEGEIRIERAWDGRSMGG